MTITAQLLRYMIITSFRMFSIMSPGENTRPILKKKKMILSIELIEENTYARTYVFLEVEAKAIMTNCLTKPNFRQFSEPLCCQIEGVR